MTTPKIQTSWDDASEQFDPQIAALLKKYNLPGIFFWPVNIVFGKPRWTMGIVRDFEIGSHTVNHFHLNTLTKDEARHEIFDSKAWLERVYQKPVRWFCYPRGRYSPLDLKLVDQAGYAFARTTKVGNAKDHGRLEVPGDVHCYQRKEYDGVDWLEYAKRKWDQAKAGHWPTFHIWGHGVEINRDGNWEKLEELFKYVTA